MKTLTSCTNKLVLDGYTEDFKIEKGRLTGLRNEKKYRPEDVLVANFFRFEGASDPGDNSILYAIETNDGTKGLLTDAYGPYADENVSRFMDEVKEMYKKTEK
ncbi:MAG TPA: phosphoribosylpyrophosphate synthetase [Chitinophagaceae bacterium]|nr:phosphoribosylpyrophosphate synthetase [Chitinophagaceae bacterium]